MIFYCSVAWSWVKLTKTSLKLQPIKTPGSLPRRLPGRVVGPAQALVGALATICHKSRKKLGTPIQIEYF